MLVMDRNVMKSCQDSPGFRLHACGDTFNWQVVEYSSLLLGAGGARLMMYFSFSSFLCAKPAGSNLFLMSWDLVKVTWPWCDGIFWALNMKSPFSTPCWLPWGWQVNKGMFRCQKALEENSGSEAPSKRGETDINTKRNTAGNERDPANGLRPFSMEIYEGFLRNTDRQATLKCSAHLLTQKSPWNGHHMFADNNWPSSP